MFFVFWDSYVIYIWVMNILCTFHNTCIMGMLQMEDCYDWQQVETDLYRALLLLTSLMGALIQSGSQPGSHLSLPLGWHVYSLAAFRMTDCLTLWAQKTSTLYIFCTSTHFSSRSIHVIYFYCPLFTLRHSCNILFTKSTITNGQRSICNNVYHIYPTPPLGQDMT